MSDKKIVAVKLDSKDLAKIDKIVRAKTVENDGEPVTRSDVIREWIFIGVQKEQKKSQPVEVPA